MVSPGGGDPPRLARRFGGRFQERSSDSFGSLLVVPFRQFLYGCSPAKVSLGAGLYLRPRASSTH